MLHKVVLLFCLKAKSKKAAVPSGAVEKGHRRGTALRLPEPGTPAAPSSWRRREMAV